MGRGEKKDIRKAGVNARKYWKREEEEGEEGIRRGKRRKKN